jgi:hypothetical protein
MLKEVRDRDWQLVGLTAKSKLALANRSEREAERYERDGEAWSKGACG